jgi:uncharacterized membrane protein
MRSTGDRIRHAIGFEIIGLALVTPLGAWLFDFPLFEIGVVGAGSAAIAALWNYVYNLGFDLALRRLTGATRKSLPTRVVHAVAFEGGLTILLMPFIAWYLGIGLLQALLMDAAFVVFYIGYAFAFNWAYDSVYRCPAGSSRTQVKAEDRSGRQEQARNT